MTTSTASTSSERARALDLVNSGLGLFINGRVTKSTEGLEMSAVDPSTGLEIAQIPRAGKADIDLAVKSAKASLAGAYGRASAKDREAMLRRIGALLERDAEKLALIEAVDAGKPIGMTRAVDIPLSLDNFNYYAGWPTKIYGETIPAGGPDMLVYTRNEPAGVSAQIIPWNFPLFDATGRIAMSLAAGCPIVLKVAEVTPLSAMYLGKLLEEADLPAGAVNIVPGYGHEAGRALVDHPDVAVIGFTGSTNVGREIGASAGRALKRVSLELGGKSPTVLFDDCDLDAAVASAVTGIFLNSGQVCSAGSRLLVQEKIYDEVVLRLSTLAKAMKVGGAFDEGVEMGPVVSAAQYDKVRSYITAGAAEGKVASGGLDRPGAKDSQGFFVAPTVFADLPANSRVINEEIFGPVLAVEKFKTFDDALRLANGGPYGLAASVWSRNGSTTTRFAHGLKAGTVWVNCYHMYDIAVPWGGVKDSGFGRERGAESLGHLLDKKVVWNAV
jgi:acyl-CoA reductase-like NAD-dependent aldehyde dehydrogenase